MTNIRYTLSFRRAAEPRNLPLDERCSIVSVVLPKKDASFEKAAEYAQGLLPQGPVWKAPFLVSAIESED